MREVKLRGLSHINIRILFYVKDNFILMILIYLLRGIYYQVKMKVWIIVNWMMKSKIQIQNVLCISGKEEMPIIQLGYRLILRKFVFFDNYIKHYLCI